MIAIINNVTHFTYENNLFVFDEKHCDLKSYKSDKTLKCGLLLFVSNS